MDRFKEFFAQSHTRVIVIVGILIIALAVPVTVRLVGQQQDLRQRAAETTVATDSAKQKDLDCTRAPWIATGQTRTTCLKTESDPPVVICSECKIETRTCEGKTETRTGTSCQTITPTPTSAPSAVVTQAPPTPLPSGGGGGGGGGKPPVGGSNPSPTSVTGPGSVEGYVFLDNDRDRTRDTVATQNSPVDQGIGGVTVTLRARTGSLSKTAQTNSSGKYEFTNLPIGTYDLRQSPPSCYETGVLSKDVTLTTTNKSATADFPLNRTAACGGDDGGSPRPTGGSGGGGGGGGGNNPFPTGGGGGNNSCGSTCSSNSQCAGAGSCTVCVRGRLGRSTCESRVSPTPTPPVTLTPIPTSTPVPTPTVTIGPNDLGANIQVTMPGIGTMVGDNNNPRNPSRSGNVLLYNTANQVVATKSATFTVSNPTASASAFIYKGLVNFGSTLPIGFYYVATDFNNTLTTQIPGVLDMKKGPTGVATAPVTPLIPGDLDRNNILDIRDYNLFIACYGTKQCAQKTLADFNDNGTVESVDYNILLRSFAIRQGD